MQTQRVTGLFPVFPECSFFAEIHVGPIFKVIFL